MEGLVNRTSPGGPRQIPDEIRAKVLAFTRVTPPSTLEISHWTSTEMSKYIHETEGVSVSQTWVSRLWREHKLQPWRQGTFKFRKIRKFEEKVRDVVGLYLNPSDTVDMYPKQRKAETYLSILTDTNAGLGGIAGLAGSASAGS